MLYLTKYMKHTCLKGVGSQVQMLNNTANVSQLEYKTQGLNHATLLPQTSTYNNSIYPQTYIFILWHLAYRFIFYQQER